MPNVLEIQDIPGGKRFVVQQAKWTPLKVALIPIGVALLLGAAAALFFSNGNWTLALVLGALAALSGALAIIFGVVLVFLALTLRQQAVFSVTANGIRLEEKNRGSDPDVIEVAEIISIHHGAPRASSGVEVGLVGDLAGLMGLAFADRSSAVWVRVGHRAIYLARQIRKAEAAQIFDTLKPIVKLS